MTLGTFTFSGKVIAIPSISADFSENLFGLPGSVENRSGTRGRGIPYSTYGEGLQGLPTITANRSLTTTGARKEV